MATVHTELSESTIDVRVVPDEKVLVGEDEPKY
jgi:hypothetical protein